MEPTMGYKEGQNGTEIKVMAEENEDRDGESTFGGARDQAATVQLKVRMKEPLRAMLDEVSARRGVSMNAEMVRRLEQSFRLEHALERAEQEREEAERKMYELMDVIIRLSRSLPSGDANRKEGQGGGIRMGRSEDDQ
jgi:hypothetical protein